MGKYLFHRLYPAVKIEELFPYNVITPVSKASAHIDLIHESVNFMVLEQENWLPWNLPGFYFNVRSFYSRPTDWMEDFAGKIEKGNVDMDEYLEPTTKFLIDIEKQTGFKWRLN